MENLRPNDNKIEKESIIEAQAYKTAIEAGVSAAELIMKYWPNPTNKDFDKDLTLEVFEKEGVGNYATIADKESEKIILNSIKSQELLNTHRIIAEESDEIVSESEWQWIIDPIDGTPPFKNGLPEFGISIGLLYGQEPRVGVIVMPAQRQLIAARSGHGVYLMSFDGEIIADLKQRKTSDLNISQLLVGYDLGYHGRGEQLSSVVAAIADKIGYPVSYGSSSTANFRLAQGLLAGYFCKTPTKFDVGAASAIIKELGGVVTDINGDEIDWNADSVSYLAALNPQIYLDLLRIMKEDN